MPEETGDAFVVVFCDLLCGEIDSDDNGCECECDFLHGGGFGNANLSDCVGMEFAKVDSPQQFLFNDEDTAPLSLRRGEPETPNIEVVMG